MYLTTFCYPNHFSLWLGEKALVEYLEEEIVNETNSLKGGKDLPTTFNGFQVKYNGADVELTKKEGNET